MNKIILGHTHYIPRSLLHSSNTHLGAVLVPEFYPNLIYSYYNEIEYFNSISGFIIFAGKMLRSSTKPLLYSLENINMLFKEDELCELKHLGLCSIQIYHHTDNKYFCKETGLTTDGHRLLRLIDNMDIALDLSHINDYWIDKILHQFSGRVLVSHCAASNLIEASTTRTNNISLQTIEKLVKRNAIIGLSFVNDTVAQYANEEKEDTIYDNIVSQIISFFSHFGCENLCLGPDYFDTSYFTKIFKKKIFIPSIFYSLDGYNKLYSDLNSHIGKGVDNIFWRNIERYYTTNNSY